MADRGWITTPALAPGGSGHDQLAIAGDQIAEATITETNLEEEIVAKLNLSHEELVEAFEAFLLELTELRDVIDLLLG